MNHLRQYIRKLILESARGEKLLSGAGYGIVIEEAFWSTKKIKSIDDVETIGDLRKLIASAQGAKQWEQTKGEAGDAVKDAIVDEILGKIPGASAAKSLFGFVKAKYLTNIYPS